MPQENQKNLIVKRAKSAILSRDFDLAERLYKGLHRSEPKNIEYLSALGDIYVQKGDDYNALNYFLEVSSLDPSNSKALNSLGGIYRRLGQYSDSIDVLQLALDIDPDEANVFYNFGFTYREMGRYDRAIECFQNVITRNPNDVLAHNHLGVIYAVEGDHDKAIEIYKRGLQIDPNHPILQLNLAQSYEVKKQYEAAATAYENALRSKPGWKDAVASYKNLLISQKKYKQIADLLKRTVALHPNDVMLKQDLGNFLISQCDYQSAVDVLENAKLIEDENTETKYLLSEAYEKNGNIFEAVSVIEDVAEDKPGDTKLQHRFAHALLSANEIDRAGEKISSLYETDNKDVQTLDLYAQYYICKNDGESAQKYYEQIKTINPQYDKYIQEAAERYLQINNVEEAERLASAYLQKNKSKTDAYITLAKVHKEKGDMDSAVDLIKRGTGDYYSNNLFANALIGKISSSSNSKSAEKNIANHEEVVEEEIETLSDFSHNEDDVADEVVNVEPADVAESVEDESIFGLSEIGVDLLKEEDDNFDFDKFEDEEVNIAPKKEEFSDLLADDIPLDDIPNEAFAVPALSAEEDDLYTEEDIHSHSMYKKSTPIVISEKVSISEPKNSETAIPMQNEMARGIDSLTNSMSDMSNLSRIVAEEARRAAEYATKNLTDNVKKEIEDAKNLAIYKTRETVEEQAVKFAEETKKATEEALKATEDAKKAAEEAIRATEEAVRLASEETANAAAAAIKEMDTLLSENLMQLDSMGSELAGLMANVVPAVENIESEQGNEIEEESVAEESLADEPASEEPAGDDVTKIVEEEIVVEDSSDDDETETVNEEVEDFTEDFAEEESVTEESVDDDATENLVNEETSDSTIDEKLNLVPHIIEMLKQKNKLNEYADLLSLFQNIKSIIGTLPPELLHEFKTSKTRLHLDYLISRLEGKPGLLATATALREEMEKNRQDNGELLENDIFPEVIDLDGDETDDDDELISYAHDKIENAIAQMGILATSLEDQELAQALVEFADEVLGKLNFGE